MSKSPKEEVVKNLRFKLPFKVYQDFWYVGTVLLNLKKKDEILAEMIKKLKELLE